MIPKTAPQNVEDEATTANPREQFLLHVLTQAVPYMLTLGKGQKVQLGPGIELEMLSNGRAGICFMVDIASLPEAT